MDQHQKQFKKPNHSQFALELELPEQNNQYLSQDLVITECTLNPELYCVCLVLGSGQPENPYWRLANSRQSRSFTMLQNQSMINRVLLTFSVNLKRKKDGQARGRRWSSTSLNNRKSGSSHFWCFQKSLETKLPLDTMTPFHIWKIQSHANLIKIVQFGHINVSQL